VVSDTKLPVVVSDIEPPVVMSGTELPTAIQRYSDTATGTWNRNLEPEPGTGTWNRA
jgi:hypothetical protein